MRVIPLNTRRFRHRLTCVDGTGVADRPLSRALITEIAFIADRSSVLIFDNILEAAFHLAEILIFIGAIATEPLLPPKIFALKRAKKTT